MLSTRKNAAGSSSIATSAATGSLGAAEPRTDSVMPSFVVWYGHRPEIKKNLTASVHLFQGEPAFADVVPFVSCQANPSSGNWY